MEDRTEFSLYVYKVGENLKAKYKILWDYHKITLTTCGVALLLALQLRGSASPLQ